MPRLFYSETAPPPSLAAHVDCLWTVAVDPAGPGNPQHYVLPDGCWTLSIGVRPSWYVRLRRPVAAPFVAPCAGSELIVGVRFRPGPPPPQTLYDARRALCPGQSVPEIAGALAGILQRGATVRDRRLDAMVSGLRHNHGQLAMAQIAEQLGISDRHLERLSNQQLGLRPKTFARIVRLQSVVRHLIENPRERLAEIAMHFGYADQTHMTRDFTELGHITPLGYRRSLEHVEFVL